MKVVAFNCSPHKDGNTSILLKKVGAEIEKAGIDYEIIQVGGTNVRGCQGCGMCGVNQNRQCAINDDMNGFIASAIEADGIIIGTPVYFSNITAEAVALINRVGYVTRSNGNLLGGKVGAPVIAVRRAGANFAYAAINYLFGICEMIIPGSSYWNMGFGRDAGEVENDKEGMGTMECLGRNMASLLKKIN